MKGKTIITITKKVVKKDSYSKKRNSYKGKKVHFFLSRFFHHEKKEFKKDQFQFIHFKEYRQK